MTTTQKKKLKLTNQLQNYFVENKLSVNEHVLSDLSVLSLKKQQMIVEGIICIFEQLFDKYPEIKNTKILGYEYELKINNNICYLFIIRVSDDGISMMGRYYAYDIENSEKITAILEQLKMSYLSWKDNFYFFFDGCDKLSYKNNTIKLRLDVLLYRFKKLNQNI